MRSIHGESPARLPEKHQLGLEMLEPRLLLNGTIFYVDDDFTAATSGWGVDHFASIQDGIDAAGSGDTVQVAAGTYNENVTINSARDGLTLQGAGAAVTIIDGGGSDTVVTLNSVDGATVTGFTIRNGSANNGGGVYVDSSDSTVSGNVITGNSADLWGGGIYVDGGSPSLINNVITDNEALFGAGTYVDYATPIYANNTIYNNTAGSCGGALYSPGSTFTMVNCILWNNTSFDLFPNDEIMVRSDTYLTIRHTIIMDGKDQIYALLGGDYSYDSTDSKANPQFVDAANGDFHLMADSPAIDAANGDAAPATDFDGTARVDDPSVVNTGEGTPAYADIGAFEFYDGAIDNEAPTVDSLQASPDPVTRPNNVTLTALGVDDPDGAGTVGAVEFYRDANGNGTLEVGTDVLLGTDTNGADGWSWTASTTGLPAGSVTFLARARDNYSAYSDAVSASTTVENAPPAIGSLTYGLSGDDLTLTAQNVTDDAGVSQVEFYLDANGNGTLEVGTDTFLGDGTQSGSDWSLTVNTAGWADGTYTVLARAQDGDSAYSNVVTTDATLENVPPAIDSLTGSLSGDTLTLTANTVTDDAGVTKVEFYLDANGNGTLEVGTDTFLGNGTQSGSDWSLAVDTAGWADGTYTMLARAQDTDSAWGDAVSTDATLENVPPVIGSLTDGLSGGNLALTANNVTDDVGVTKVEFYLDANGNGTLEVGTDTLLGDGTQSGSDWRLAVNTSGWADGTYTVLARAQDTDSAWSNTVTDDAVIGERLVGRISDTLSAAYVDVYAREDISLDNFSVKFSAGYAAAVAIGGSDPMDGLGLVIHSDVGTQGAVSIKDGRKGDVSDLAFIATDGSIKAMKLKSAGLSGYDLNGKTLGDMTFAADIDGDGDTADPTAIYSEGAVGKVSFTGDMDGDVWIGGTDPKKGLAFNGIQSKSGGFYGDLVALGGGGKFALGGTFGSSLEIQGSLKGFQLKGGNFAGELDVSGDLGKLQVKGGMFRAGADVNVGGMLKSVKLDTYQTDNGGTDFGILAGDVGKLGLGATKLSADSLPFADGDFLVEMT